MYLIDYNRTDNISRPLYNFKAGTHAPLRSIKPVTEFIQKITLSHTHNEIDKLEGSKFPFSLEIATPKGRIMKNDKIIIRSRPSMSSAAEIERVRKALGPVLSFFVIGLKKHVNFVLNGFNTEYYYFVKNSMSGKAKKPVRTWVSFASSSDMGGRTNEEYTIKGSIGYGTYGELNYVRSGDAPSWYTAAGRAQPCRIEMQGIKYDKLKDVPVEALKLLKNTTSFKAMNYAEPLGEKFLNGKDKYVDDFKPFWRRL